MSYVDEIRGLSIGTANGLRRGYEEGHTEGWNAAIRAMEPRFEALDQTATDLQQDRDDMTWIANALCAVASAALAAVEEAPVEVQRAAIKNYADVCELMLDQGLLRCRPDLDPGATKREPDIMSWLPGIAERLRRGPNNGL